MPSSGEISVLNKIAELAIRCGVKPTIADVSMVLHLPDDEECYYTLGMIDGNAATPEELAGVTKVSLLLGLDEVGNRRAETLLDVEQIVDRALALAPRTRGRTH
jgi:hypothetical protein